MRIVVTGATGMIGRALIEHALDRGDDVVAICRPGSAGIPSLPGSDRLSVIEADISGYGDIRDSERCDVFFHLAWMKTSGAARDDARLQTQNIQYALDAVDLAGSWGAKTFIGAGSQAEYGIADRPLNGDMPVNPESGYGIAKFAAGRLCSLLCRQKGIRFNWARILSVYGENDADHTLIKYVINTILDGGVPELTPCEQTWDYIHSDDAARALYAIGTGGKDGRTYCIGSGAPHPLKWYVERTRDAVNKNAELRFGAREYYPHQPMVLCADISQLTEDTGFVPRIGFEEGIARVVSHVVNNRE